MTTYFGGVMGTCTGPDCDRPAIARGLCSGHYRWRLRHPRAPLQPLRGPRGRLGGEALKPQTVWLPPRLIRLLRESGAESVPAAIRLVLEGWRIRRERGIE